MEKQTRKPCFNLNFAKLQYLRQNEKKVIFHEIQLCNPLIYNGHEIRFYTDFEIGEGIVN